MCSKTLASLSTQPSLAIDHDGEPFFEPPAPEYTRRPALLHKIAPLSEQREIDYMFTHPFPDPGIRFRNIMGQLLFLVCRDQVFKNGDLSSLQRIFNQLVDSVKGVEGFRVEGSKKTVHVGVWGKCGKATGLGDSL